MHEKIRLNEIQLQKEEMKIQEKRRVKRNTNAIENEIIIFLALVRVWLACLVCQALYKLALVGYLHKSILKYISSN
jgi:hypothetical protein